MIKDYPQPTYVTCEVLSPSLTNCGILEPYITLAKNSGLDTFKTSYAIFNREIVCVSQNDGNYFKEDFIEIILN